MSQKLKFARLRRSKAAEKTRSREDAAWEHRWRKYEVFGLWAAAAVGLLAIGISTRDAREEREATFAHLRAVVEFKGATLQNTDVEWGPMRITPMYVNIGSTPANNVQQYIFLLRKKLDPNNVGDGNEYKDCPMKEVDGVDGFGSLTIHAGDTSQVLVRQTLFVDDEQDPAKRAYFAVGVITYADVFFPQSERHRHVWCVKFADPPDQHSFGAGQVLVDKAQEPQ